MYDVIVVGAGPAGIMASIEAARNYKQVLLIDSNPVIGKKLSITGGGRCNVTNNKTIENLMEYIHNGKFLYSALNNYGPTDIIEFFESRDLKLKEENLGRMFPITDNASDVIYVLEQELKTLNVTLRLNTKVTDIIIEDGYCNGVKIGDEEVRSYNTVIATGGKSYKHTGSVGLGLEFAKKCKHTVIEPKPALTPLKTKSREVSHLQGVSVRSVNTYNHDKSVCIEKNDILFRHDGLSGPGVLKISDTILENENKMIIFDLCPDFKEEQLVIKIENLIQSNRQKTIPNALKELGVSKIIEEVLNRSFIDLERKALHINPKEMTTLAKNFKNLDFTVIGDYGIDKGFVTKGGVDLKEVIPKTFESKLVGGIYFVGEVLNIHAHTGGYNITACMSMGAKCGSSIY